MSALIVTPEEQTVKQRAYGASHGRTAMLPPLIGSPQTGSWDPSASMSTSRCSCPGPLPRQRMSQEYPTQFAPDVLTRTPHGAPAVPSALMSFADALRNATVWSGFMCPYFLRWHSRIPIGVFGAVHEPPPPDPGGGG